MSFHSFVPQCFIPLQRKPLKILPDIRMILQLFIQRLNNVQFPVVHWADQTAHNLQTSLLQGEHCSQTQAQHSLVMRALSCSCSASSAALSMWTQSTAHSSAHPRLGSLSGVRCGSCHEAPTKPPQRPLQRRALPLVPFNTTALPRTPHHLFQRLSSLVSQGSGFSLILTGPKRPSSKLPSAHVALSLTWQSDVSFGHLGGCHKHLLLIDQQPLVGPGVPEQPEVPCQGTRWECTSYRALQ